MSNIDRGHGTNVGIELQSITVVGRSEKRGECWLHNVSNQFPINCSDTKNGEVSVDVDVPHKGYVIQTKLVNGKPNGVSRILNKENIKIASLVFVDGVASGPCTLNDDEGRTFFKGYFENGYRKGKGKEYDENGNVIFEGFFEHGKRMNIVPMKEMKGYWKEMNEKNEIISICQKDEEGNNDGICYFYSNGNIDRISEWRNGEEISDSGHCRIYDEPHHVFFEGYFENGKREGRGKEIDLNGKVVFDGFYEHGEKLNIVELKEMKGYWKEMNERNEIISICKKDDECRNDGICYFYSNGNIDKVSKWKNGEELNVSKRFEGKKMTEFVNGVKRYEGEYRDSIKHNYPREGKGEEYDVNGKSLSYLGHFWNGKRHGMGKYYRNGEVVFDGIWMKGYRKSRIVLGYLITSIILMCACIAIETLYNYNDYYYDRYAHYIRYLLDYYFHYFFVYFFDYYSRSFVAVYIIYWILLLCCNCSILFGKSVVNNNSSIKKLKRLYMWLVAGIVYSLGSLLLFIFFTLGNVIINWC